MFPSQEPSPFSIGLFPGPQDKTYGVDLYLPVDGAILLNSVGLATTGGRPGVEGVQTDSIPSLPVGSLLGDPITGIPENGAAVLGTTNPSIIPFTGPAATVSGRGRVARSRGTGVSPKAGAEAIGPSATAFGEPLIDRRRRVVSLAVTFDEPVSVKGKPSIPFTFAGEPTQLVYATRSGPNVLTFRAKPERKAALLSENIGEFMPNINLNGGTITDKLGNVARSLANPTDVVLAPANIAENNLADAVIGVLTTTDTDAGRDTFTYSLIPGVGSTDNSLFKIEDSQLKTAVSFNYEAKASYSVRVRATDSGSLFAEKALTISIDDVNDFAPVFTSGTTGSFAESTPITTGIYTALVTDGDGTPLNRAVSFSLRDGGDKSLLNIDPITGVVTLKAGADFKTKSSYSFTVLATNTAVPSLSVEHPVTLRVTPSDVTPPRVTGANSTGHSTVLVAFSEAMDENIKNPALFAISQTNVNAEAGVMSVLRVDFANDSHTAVRLTTGPQNELSYTLKVLGGTDPAGNAIAAPTLQVDPSKATFTGTPPNRDLLVDSDHDGLTDNDENRGWSVVVKEINGTLSRRQVSSSPQLEDTDGDGMLDALEAALRTDPRDPDTDDDQLTDYQEYYEIFCDHLNQDTDGDGVDDGTEFLGVLSNPNFKDTDGDQFEDGYEIATALRNPLAADVPQVSIGIGDINLQLDLRFIETTSTESRVLEARSVNSTLSQTDNESFSHTSGSSHEFSWGFSESVNFSLSGQKDTAGPKLDLNFEATQNTTDTTTTENTRASSKETQKIYEDSLSNEREATEGASVSREVVGAKMQVAISLRNLSSTVAYSVNNLQITAFIQDPRNVTRLKPIATLLPDVEPEGGIAMGPLVLERGPFIFSNDTIYPSLVEDLMKNPRSLIFRISNYDLTDEADRKFAFASTDLAERTAALVIDYGGSDGNGDGQGDATEYNRVSTSPGRIAIDTNGDNVVDENDRRVAFDLPGVHVGTTLRQILASMRMSHYYEYIDADHNATLLAAGIPASAIKDSSTQLTSSQRRMSYSTFLNASGAEQLYRVRNVALDPTLPQAWVIINEDGVDQAIDFDQYILQTNGSITLAFVSDLDDDGVPASAEFTAGTSDNLKDTDGDGLDDRFESFRGWDVTVVGESTRHVYARGDAIDSDGDGLTDIQEAPGLLIRDDRGLITEARRLNADDFITDPLSADTDYDGVSDYDEINGYSVTLKYPESGPPNLVVRSNPLSPDSDGDGVSDGIEVDLGLNPQQPDASKFRDTDKDGLVDYEEDLGWDVTYFGVSSTVGSQGPVAQTYRITASRSDRDSDDDGLSDLEEKRLLTDPMRGDTDGDGLSDFAEINLSVIGGVRTISLKYNPLDADLDNDKRSDGDEVNHSWLVSVDGRSPYQITSDPKLADQDGDGWADSEERAAGTDPTKFDTDGDNSSIGDRREHEISTNPLKPDKRVTVTVAKLRIDGDADFEDNIEVYGLFEINNLSGYTSFRINDGDRNTIVISDGGGESNLEARGFYKTGTMDSTGAPIILKTTDFRDDDGTGSDDDVFENSQRSVSYAEIVDGYLVELENNGPNVGSDVKLTTTFRFNVVSS
jgi:hypothetical protein